MISPSRIYPFVLGATLMVFAFLLYMSVTQLPTDIPQTGLRGKQVFQRSSCIECHTIFGNGGYSGGDLTKTYKIVGRDVIVKYLVDPPILSGAESKRHFQLSLQEAENVADFLQFLSGVDTASWPTQSQ
jgi:nitric oxide reductase subunit C